MRREANSARVIVMPAVRVSLIAISSTHERPFMPRDHDKNNDSRGRRDRPSGGKGRSGAARGPEKKFAKRGFAGKSDGDKRDGERRPYAGDGKPYAGNRDDRPPRRDYGDAPRPPRFNRDDRPARSGGGDKRPYTP